MTTDNITQAQVDNSAPEVPGIVAEDLRPNMCSHLQRKLFEPDGVYYPIWQAMQHDTTLTAVVRARQLHIYRNGKKILILAVKAKPKIIREDALNSLIINL